MKSLFALTGLLFLIFAFSSCSIQDEKPIKPVAPAAAVPAAKAETKAAPAEKALEEKAEKAKAEKVSGDNGLLDTEKNYMIFDTKEGKLMTLDFNQNTKATELKEKEAKLSDIGLGSSAVVEYIKKGDKNVFSKIEFTPAKGGD